MADRVVDSLAVNVPLDPYLSLRAVSAYSGLSVRKLREFLAAPFNPLPCYRVGGKVLVRRSEFDAWISRFRTAGSPNVTALVDEVLTDLRPEL
jgi:excisionase family DNA binding protein